MLLYKGKKYKIRLSGMCISYSPGDHKVMLDKCVRARILGMDSFFVITFKNKAELDAFCTYSGTIQIGRRVVITLDVIVLGCYGKTLAGDPAYFPLVMDTSRMFSFYTYGLDTNVMLNSSQEEFQFVSENPNEPDFEWPEEEPGQV
jgi:hypothetical protein